jgi:hypothetical protein
MSSAVSGLADLNRNLSHIQEVASKRAASAAIGAALAPIVKSMKSSINGSSASAAAKKAARQAVGKRFLRGGTNKLGKVTALVAKVGFAVGMSGKRIAKQSAKKAERARPKGVGITASNIHWLVLGTGDRVLTGKGRAQFERSMKDVPVGVLSGHRGKGAGHPTGRVEPLFAGLAPQALAAGAAEAINAAAAKARSVILAEVRKKYVKF